jgi:hypothetical protein
MGTDFLTHAWIDPAADYLLTDATALVAADPTEVFAAVWRGELPVAGSAGRWWVRGADLIAWLDREPSRHP